MKLFKYIPVAATAITTTGGLFFLMQSLIATEEVILPEEPKRIFPNYHQDNTKEPIIKELDRVELPKEVVEPPKSVDPMETDNNKAGPVITVTPPVAPTDNGGPHIQINGFQDGEQIPLVRVQASYPRNALSKGVSGWATVAFTIDEYGSVVDPYIVAAEPQGYFERSSLKAIKKFRYKPKVINGQAVQSQGQFRMVFELEE